MFIYGFSQQIKRMRAIFDSMPSTICSLKPHTNRFTLYFTSFQKQRQQKHSEVETKRATPKDESGGSALGAKTKQTKKKKRKMNREVEPRATPAFEL